jgi:hypothetical protein
VLHIQGSAGDEPRMARAEMSCRARAEISCMARAEVSLMTRDGGILNGWRLLLTPIRADGIQLYFTLIYIGLVALLDR